jgi:hypothetical protein
MPHTMTPTDVRREYEPHRHHVRFSEGAGAVAVAATERFLTAAMAGSDYRRHLKGSRRPASGRWRMTPQQATAAE